MTETERERPNRPDDGEPGRPGGREDGDGSRQPPKGPRVDPEDAVEEASYESFPASDPPGFTPGKVG